MNAAKIILALTLLAGVAWSFGFTTLVVGHLNLLSAVFTSVLAGIGMLYFQDLMPGQAGTATTLFTNTIRVGWIIAGAIAGAVAEIWNYHAVFYAALAMAAGATLCLWRLREA